MIGEQTRAEPHEADAALGVFALDAFGAVASCDAAFAAMLGFASSSEALGKILEPGPEIARSGSDGTIRRLLRVARRLPEGGSDGVLVDVTAFAAGVEHQARGAAADALGRTLGAVGHELNNLLAIILNYTGIVESELVPQHPLREDIGEIRDTAMRAVALAKKLLQLGRREMPRAAPIDVAALAHDMATSIAHRDGIEIVTPAAPAAVFAIADPNHLVDSLRAIAENAFEAMPSGGRLEIACVEMVLGPADEPGVAAGTYASLCIVDTGRGMSSTELARALEPFYSTKPNPKGLGLGLSVAYGRIRQFGGHLLIRSKPGGGTTVNMLLPVVPAPSTREVRHSDPPRKR